MSATKTAAAPSALVAMSAAVNEIALDREIIMGANNNINMIFFILVIEDTIYMMK